MQSNRGHVSKNHPHIEALLAKHHSLSSQIKDARNHPSTTDEELQRWKIERLRLKDEIAQTRTASG